MPVTISGDATKRIEALVYNLSDERMRELCVELRDSLVRRLWNVQWKGGPSVYIGRGLTAYTEPVRTPTGGWMCGVGSLDILHREDAPPRTITEFLYWYQTQYMPEEKAKRVAEKVKVARREAAAEAIWQRNVRLFGAYRTQVRLTKEMATLRSEIIGLDTDIVRLSQVFPTRYDFRNPALKIKYDRLRAKRRRQVRDKKDQIRKKKILLEKKHGQMKEALKRARELKRRG